MSRRKAAPEKPNNEKLENGDTASEKTEEEEDVEKVDKKEDGEDEEPKDTKETKNSKSPSKAATRNSSSSKKETPQTNFRKRKASKPAKEDSDDESDTEYEVNKIVDMKTDRKGKKKFLVNWKGYSNKENSWEPEENLSCNDLIEEFFKDNEKKTPKKPAKSESSTPSRKTGGRKRN